MKKICLFACIFCPLLLPVGLNAQSAAGGNNDIAVKKAIGLFYASISDNSGLFNGTEYIMYDQRIKGTPYFMDGGRQPGDIFYNGTLYNNVPLIYEITTGNVVVRQFGDGVYLNLVNEKINYFTLFNHSFIHLAPDSANTISDGFYDRLFNGATKVYVQRRKSVYEDPHTFEKSFVENDHYFICKNNVFYQVSGRGSVLGVFKDKKKDIAKFARQSSDIDFRKDLEYAMVKMAEFYDKLTH